MWLTETDSQIKMHMMKGQHEKHRKMFPGLEGGSQLRWAGWCLHGGFEMTLKDLDRPEAEEGYLRLGKFQDKMRA